MSIELNHTIVAARDPKASAQFLAGILGLEVDPPLAHFTPITLANRVTLDYDQSQDTVQALGRARLAELRREAELGALARAARQARRARKQQPGYRARDPGRRDRLGSPPQAGPRGLAMSLSGHPDPSRTHQGAPARRTETSVRRVVLFASALQQSDAPTATTAAEAATATVRRFGIQGCVNRMAQEFGDHPDQAAERMRWICQLTAQVSTAAGGAA
jgi:hypothetical protein